MIQFDYWKHQVSEYFGTLDSEGDNEGSCFSNRGIQVFDWNEIHQVFVNCSRKDLLYHLRTKNKEGTR